VGKLTPEKEKTYSEHYIRTLKWRRAERASPTLRHVLQYDRRRTQMHVAHLTIYEIRLTNARFSSCQKNETRNMCRASHIG
jgi:hypothetical protein